MDDAIVRTALDAQAAKSACLGYVPDELYRQLYDNNVPQQSKSKSKTSTTLVSIGYAMRIRSVLHAVRTFLEHYCNNDTNTPVQIVLLGAGLDVTGLYCLLPIIMPQEQEQEQQVVSVIEVDLPAMVEFKQRQLLANIDWLVPSLSSSGAYHHRQYPNCTYQIITADFLRGDLDALWEATNTTIPTLVVSELVLAYVPEQQVDALLQTLVQRLDSRSCLVVYEPLGPDQRQQRSVLNSYKNYYCDQFQRKLNRGKSNDNDNDNNKVFAPFAHSCSSAAQRLKQAGWWYAYAACASRVLCGSEIWKLNNNDASTFDEHAALTLHLSSYVFGCGFLRDTDWQLRHKLCPWRYMPPKRVPINNEYYYVSCTEQSDENMVRELFSETYQDYFDQYPAIRKMVQTALRKDLGQGNEESAIFEHYSRNGGAFLVVTDSSRRNVWGGIGIRKCSAKEKKSRNLMGSVVYEIHRLFVSSSLRRGGIGTSLFNCAMEIIKKKNKSSTQIIATTPTILQSANQFYVAQGFQILSETVVGDLTMRIHSKHILS